MCERAGANVKNFHIALQNKCKYVKHSHLFNGLTRGSEEHHMCPTTEERVLADPGGRLQQYWTGWGRGDTSGPGPGLGIHPGLCVK